MQASRGTWVNTLGSHSGDPGAVTSPGVTRGPASAGKLPLHGCLPSDLLLNGLWPQCVPFVGLLIIWTLQRQGGDVDTGTRGPLRTAHTCSLPRPSHLRDKSKGSFARTRSSFPTMLTKARPTLGEGARWSCRELPTPARHTGTEASRLQATAARLSFCFHVGNSFWFLGFLVTRRASPNAPADQECVRSQYPATGGARSRERPPHRLSLRAHCGAARLAGCPEAPGGAAHADPGHSMC